jgi:hypothetical protein
MRVARTITAGNWTEVRGALDVLLAAHGRAIVRGLHGVGGDGSAIVRADGRGVEGFWGSALRDPHLRVFPLLVQEFVEHAPSMGCPALDLLITDDGPVGITLSAMTVGGHRFQSVSVGSGSLGAALGARTVALGRDIGRAVRDLGFRGWFCVDLVAGTDGGLYVTEFNARRSSAMAAISLLSRWRDEDPEPVLHSYDALRVNLPAGATYERDVRPHFEHLWKHGVRAYPLSVRGLAESRQTIGVLAAAASAAQAREVIAGLAAALGDRTARPVQEGTRL